MKKSSVISPGRAVRSVMTALQQISEDRINLYAAQASFFTVIASIPFLMLLLSLARLIFPGVIDSVFVYIGTLVPPSFTSLFDTVYTEISKKASASVISFSAVTMLWSSSRGVAAVTRGVAGVYGTREHSDFISEIFRSLFHTAAFILSIIGALTVLVFGVTIRNTAVSHFPASQNVFDLILHLRSFIFFFILTLIFSVIFHAVSRNGIKNGSDAAAVPSKFRAQLPGAALAAAGWMLFSYFFSLYIEYFHTASYIYGSLATVVLFMLWLYFCMIILLIGAEANKLLHIMRNKPLKT